MSKKVLADVTDIVQAADGHVLQVVVPEDEEVTHQEVHRLAVVSEVVADEGVHLHHPAVSDHQVVRDEVVLDEIETDHQVVQAEVVLEDLKDHQDPNDQDLKDQEIDPKDHHQKEPQEQALIVPTHLHHHVLIVDPDAHLQLDHLVIHVHPEVVFLVMKDHSVRQNAHPNVHEEGSLLQGGHQEEHQEVRLETVLREDDRVREDHTVLEDHQVQGDHQDHQEQADRQAQEDHLHRDVSAKPRYNQLNHHTKSVCQKDKRFIALVFLVKNPTLPS